MANFTDEKIKDLFIEAYVDALDAGLPVPPAETIILKLNQNLGRSWGTARRLYDPKFTYVVSLSKTLCQFTNENSILNTIIHELVHCSGARGHRSEFKILAKMINDRFPGKYHVSRTTGANEKMTEEQITSAYKYVIKCPKCGKIWGFNRKTRVVSFHEKYYCPTCSDKKAKKFVHLIRIK